MRVQRACRCGGQRRQCSSVVPVLTARAELQAPQRRAAAQAAAASPFGLPVVPLVKMISAPSPGCCPANRCSTACAAAACCCRSTSGSCCCCAGASTACTVAPNGCMQGTCTCDVSGESTRARSCSTGAAAGWQAPDPQQASKLAPVPGGACALRAARWPAPQTPRPPPAHTAAPWRVGGGTEQHLGRTEGWSEGSPAGQRCSTRACPAALHHTLPQQRAPHLSG